MNGPHKHALLPAFLTSILVVAFVALLTPTALALAFSAPTAGATYTENATVTFTWDDTPVTFTLTGSAPETINATTTQRTLGPGNYTATILNATNASANVSFTVNQTISNGSGNNTGNQTTSSNQALGLSTDAALYEAGTSARITVTVTEPEQLSLVVTRPSGTNDAYTIAVTTQTDFLYATTANGLYSIAVTGQTSGATAASSFTVQNTSMSVQITGGATGTSGRVTSYGSIVQGGAAPYQYAWVFSDNTTSAGSTTNHVYDEPGTYTATLVVTDTNGKTASATRTTIINEETYRLTVNVLGDNGRLLKNASVSVTPTIGGATRTEVTDDLGRVRFLNLTPATYNLTTRYTASEIVPVQNYTDNKTVVLEEDETITIEFSVPDPAEIALNASNTTNATNATIGTNSSNTTGTNTGGTGVLASSTTEPATSETASLAALRQEYESSLAASRTEAQNTLRDREAAIARSDVRSAIARVLKLEDRFSNANTAIRSAQTVEALERALADAPSEITILSRDTTVITRDADEIESDVERYIEAMNVDDDTAKDIRYSVKESIHELAVSNRRSVVRVTDGDGSSTTYTVIERTFPLVPGMTYVENIPKAFAQDASELSITGSHEVIEADPLIRFLTHEYSYFVEKQTDEEPTVIPVPATLLERPELIGLVGIKLDFDSSERGGIYLAIILFIVIGVLGANILLRYRDGSTVQAFSEAASLALDAAESGNALATVHAVKELETIATSLDEKDRRAVADTLAVLREAAANAEFAMAIEHAKNAIALADTLAMAHAYERLLASHAALPQEAQTRTRAALNAVHTNIEEAIADHENADNNRSETTGWESEQEVDA